MIEMLYKKKIIRDFLSLFTENYWKQLIVSIVEYGIINFKKHHNIASLTPEEIIQVVESLKKDENLVDKKKSGGINSNQITKGKNKENQSRSRSKPKPISKVTKSNIINNKYTNTNSNSVEKNYRLSSKNNMKAKPRTAQTPSRDGLGLKGLNNSSNMSNINLSQLANKKLYERNESSRSLKPSVGERSTSKNKTQIKSQNLLTKNNNLSSTNIKTFKSKTNFDSEYTSNKTNSHNIKKRPNEILEQIHLNKLKEKKKPINQNTQSDTEKKTVKKFTNVESKIKGALESDKKIYNMLKNARGESEDKFSNNFNHPQIGKQGEKYIGDGRSNNTNTNSKVYTQNTSNPNNESNISINKPQQNILSLEERLNGLTQKISKIEKSSSLNMNSSLKYNSGNIQNENQILNNTSTNNQDEDYIPEDQIDLNKYNYLYNNYNQIQDLEDRKDSHDNCVEDEDQGYNYKQKHLLMEDDEEEENYHNNYQNQNNYDDLEEEEE